MASTSDAEAKKTVGVKGPPSVFVFGAGAVGTALARAILERGGSVVGAHCRTEQSAQRASARLGVMVSSGAPPAQLSEAEMVILSVPDPTIPTVSSDLAHAGLCRGQVVVHCAGAMSAQALEPLRDVAEGLGTFHPLLSFADIDVASALLSSCAFAVEGDGRAVETAGRLAAFLGGFPIAVGAEDRALYHAAAAIASNHLVALTAHAASCLGAMGFDRGQALDALRPLMESTFENLRQVGVPAALTGPVSRGDVTTVAKHLKELAHRAGDQLPIYRALALVCVDLAEEQRSAPSADLKSLRRLLKSP